MSWHWILLIIILALGNFLMLGSQIIAVAQYPAVLASGGDIKYRGTSRYFAGTIAAFFLQSITAITLSALIIRYLYFITEGQGKYIFAWIIGTIGAIYPIWQAWRLSRYERIAEPESYIAKEAIHSALPLSLLVTIIVTLLFVFIPALLNTVFYWLTGFTTFLVIAGIVLLVLAYKNQKSPQ